MTLIKKIAVIINWPRELDMYEEIIKILPKNKLEILVNDSRNKEKERKNASLIISKNLKVKKRKFKFLSQIYGLKKYKILISTGEISSNKVTFGSVLKHLYAITIGSFLNFSKLSYLSNKLFGRPFNADSYKSSFGYIWYPERVIGEKIIKFPDGIDLKLKHYPYKELEKNFDIFFTISDFEKKLIQKKFKKKQCLVIGYPRYTNIGTEKNIKKILSKSFNLSKKKKIIYWTPTHIDNKSEENLNIYLWLKQLVFLQKDYNIVVRPHPKTIASEPNIEKVLKNFNYFVDKDPNRKMGDMYKISDLIIGDFGGAVFSAIYLNKPVILLNMPKKSKFVEGLKESQSLDLELRKNLISLNLNNSKEIIAQKINYARKSYIKSKVILKIRNRYFGKNKKNSNLITKNFLLKHL